MIEMITDDIITEEPFNMTPKTHTEIKDITVGGEPNPLAELIIMALLAGFFIGGSVLICCLARWIW